jgi:Ca2+-binding RTX toxin-like protein
MDGSVIDADYYRVTLTGGHRYTFSASANISISDTLDAVALRLRDASGAVLSPDKFADAARPSFVFDVPGNGDSTYYLAISAGGAGAFQNKTGSFTVSLADNGTVDPGDLLPPVISDTPGGSVERHLGALSGQGQFFDTLGSDDTGDRFSFDLSGDAIVDWTVSLNASPDSQSTGKQNYYTGVNHIGIHSGEDYSTLQPYTVDYSIRFLGTSYGELDTVINAGLTEGIGFIFDVHELLFDVAKNAIDPKTAAEYLKQKLSLLEFIGLAIDVSFALNDIEAAYAVGGSDGAARQTYIETFDLVAKYASMYAGAGLGAAFAGGPFGLIIGGASGKIIYNFILSEQIREYAGSVWDENVSDIQQAQLISAAISGSLPTDISLPETSYDAIEFDPNWYLATYQDAAEEVRSGDFPSAYIHYITTGIDLGYLPNAAGSQLSRAELAYGDLQDVLETNFRPDVITVPLASLVGDGLSPEEAELLSLINDVRGADLAVDSDLTAIANRKSWDIVHNVLGSPVELPDVVGPGWAQYWSDGSRFRDGIHHLSSVDGNLVVVAGVDLSGTPQNALAVLQSDPGASEALMDEDFRSVGAAEYGGVWAIVLSDSGTSEPAASDPAGRASRQSGGAGDDILGAGTWASSLWGGGGKDQLFGSAHNDMLYPGVDHDSITTGAGNDLIAGGPADLTGDRILDFTTEDSLRVDGVRFEIGAMTVSAGSAILTIDTDGDSVQDTTVTLEGSFPGSFQVTPSPTGGPAFTTITYDGIGPTTIFPGTPGNDNYCHANGGDQAPGFVNDSMTGLAGNDCFSPKGGVDTVFGGTGVDTLDYSAASVVFGAPPAGAVINLASGVSTDPWGNADFTLELENAQGTEHGDWLVGTEGDGNTLTGLGGNDTAVGLAGNDTLDLGAGNDQGYGYAGNDTITGGVGNDTAYGSEGTDSLTGGADNDLLVGGPDNDTVYGEAGNDLMFGEGGDDSLNGADGDDVADGGDGNDTIDLGPGNNFGFAGAGIDTVIGNSGQDVLFGQGDNDSLSGGEALDNLLGGLGNDTLDGGGAGDNLLGEAGDDVIYGGGGNDVLDGGPGIDQLFGQAGSDTFVHRTGEGSGNSATPDVIADFQGAGGGGFPEDDFLFLDVLAGGATFAPAGGGLAADVWKLTDGAVTEYLKITGVTALVLGVDYGFF